MRKDRENTYKSDRLAPLRGFGVVVLGILCFFIILWILSIAVRAFVGWSI